jgi:hypothetical protein
VVGAGLVAGSFWLRFGKLTSTGYNNESFWFKVVDGLRGLLFGPGRSIFIYAPLLVLSVLGMRALWRRSRPAAVGVLVALTSAVLLVANWWCWWGGICWGPRLVLPVLPLASIGAAALLADPRKWKTTLSIIIALFGLYVQGIGFAFKHDFDIYFWMNGNYEEEKRAWFELKQSSIWRMPRHFKEHPWDLSSSFLTLEQTGASTVEIGGQPVRRVEVAHRGDALIFNWTITDIFVVLKDGSRVPAGQLGARLDTFNGQAGEGALDGNPATRWATGSKRLDGMWVRLELEHVHDDIVRLELEHMPSERDFPNGLSAKIQADDGPSWTEVSAHAATPRLRWSPLIFVFAGLGLALALGGVRRQAPGPVPEPVPPGN